MRITGLALFLAQFVLLAHFGQAQQYLAKHVGTEQKVVVPDAVVKSFQTSFPTVPHDSIISWDYLVAPENFPDIPPAYRVVFTQHGVRGNAEFNKQGRLGEYEAEIAMDSLPVRVSRTISRHLLKNAQKNGYTMRAYVRVGVAVGDDVTFIGCITTASISGM